MTANQVLTLVKADVKRKIITAQKELTDDELVKLISSSLTKFQYKRAA